MCVRKELEYMIDENNCWVITSHIPDSKGYAHFRRDGKTILIHRYMYNKEFGNLKDEDIIRHKCDNSICCNPNHLEKGTHADNVRDRVERERSAKGSNNGRSKLNEEEALFIKYDTKHTQKELAKLFSVDRKVIYKIKNNINWKHI